MIVLWSYRNVALCIVNFVPEVSQLSRGFAISLYILSSKGNSSSKGSIKIQYGYVLQFLFYPAGNFDTLAVSSN
jgi:hypothetical protein